MKIKPAQWERLMLPKSVTNEKLSRGQSTSRRKGNMLVVYYQVKKEILLLSIMYKLDIVNVRKKSHGDLQRPKVIHDYNPKMEGVDRNNAMIANYSCIRISYKWYINFFFHFLEEALYNAFVSYSAKHSFFSVIPPSKSKEKPQKRCVVCYESKIPKKSCYHCKNCQDHPGWCSATWFHDISHSD